MVRLLHALTITTAVMLLLLALWLLARRVEGQLQQPLSAPTLVLVAITLASLTSWLRIVWHHTGLRLSRRNGRAALAWTFPSVVVLLLSRRALHNRDRHRSAAVVLEHFGGGRRGLVVVRLAATAGHGAAECIRVAGECRWLPSEFADSECAE